MALRQQDLNLYRIPAARFGAFCLVVLALRQQGCVRRTKNPSNLVRRYVRSSFFGEDFCSGKEVAAGNTLCISKANDAAWVEIRPKKPARI